MRILKKVISLALCAVIPFALASCSDEGGEEKVTSTTQVSSIESTTESKEDLLARVIEANLLENLLKRNESVSFKTEYDGESTTEIYFTFNSETVRAVDQNLYYAETHLIVVEYKGMNLLSVNGERFAVRAFFDMFGTEEENEDTPWYNDTIAYPLINDNLSLREETDEYYIFENLDDDPDDELYIQTVCYVDKQTLNVTKIVNDNDGYVVEKEYIYNKPLELMNVLDDWNGEKKNVTVVFETYKDGEQVKYTEEYEVPVNWEVIADNNLYDTVFAAYLDEGYTKEYEYPGDGVDYTIYATSSVG